MAKASTGKCESLRRILKDKKSHCRNCWNKVIQSEQPAGSGGIQGLRRGDAKNPGWTMVKESAYCETCQKNTTHDRWTGEESECSAAAGVSKTVIERVLKLYDNKDAVENRRRSPANLVVDHRHPMIRWGQAEERTEDNATDEVLRKKFQILKKDDTGNHNKLKAEACKKCMETGQRGYPLGIKFFYEGGPDWPNKVPPKGNGSESGCSGCGWYDFEAWRTALNKRLSQP